MKPRYQPEKIEAKWQKFWAKEKLFQAKDFSAQPKKYILDMFPYPSGEGLHVGHPEGYTATDIYCRFLRMNGYNVLHPMGWDAFGLPTENYAIKTGIQPAVATKKNIDNFRRQIKSLGFSYDWSREIDTTDPDYYRWTQWIFLQLFKRGLAYEAVIPINWCPSCKTGLANEEVNQGCCERCGVQVERRDLKQWLLKITAYADRLLAGLDRLDWPESIKVSQKNWIGKSEGALVKFKIKNHDSTIEVYTTRPDTLFGATYMVLAPENRLVAKLKEQIKNWPAVEKYIQQARHKSDLERTDLAKEKTGVELAGVTAINPVNQKEIPIWLSDYVLLSYGTGAIMAVPAHDQRDWEFAKKFKLEIIEVIAGGDISQAAFTEIEQGKLINSDFLDGLKPSEAIKKMTAWLEKNHLGRKAINYKLRDWVFSRQRYWGEPIPLIHCPKCGVVPVPENELPLKLPPVKKYEPTGTGESPLAAISDWVKTACPQCGGPANRETNTMPQWAGSSWYWLRYLDPKNNRVLAEKKKMAYWLPVDVYIGGAEHAVLHLLYARFWNMFLFDLGLVPIEEPFVKLVNQGMILGEDGEKMSKSRGNVINPDEILNQYGADIFRLYEMFMGPLEDAKPWNTRGIVGIKRFLEKIWDLYHQPDLKITAPEKISVALNKTIQKVTADIENLKFNTAISAMMIFINELAAAQNKSALKDSADEWSREEKEKFLMILSPFAPHLAEELWQQLGQPKSIVLAAWPKPDVAKIKDELNEFAVQINGRLRAKLSLPVNISETEAVAAAKKDERVKKYLADKKIKKTIFVPKRLISFVTD